MSTEDPSALAKQAKQVKSDEQNRKNFLISAMKRPEGQAFLYDLLERCHVYHTPFTGDNNRTNFALGEQNIGLRLLADLIAASEAGYMGLLRYGQRRTTDPRNADSVSGTDSDPERGTGEPADERAAEGT